MAVRTSARAWARSSQREGVAPDAAWSHRAPQVSMDAALRKPRPTGTGSKKSGKKKGKKKKVQKLEEISLDDASPAADRAAAEATTAEAAPEVMAEAAPEVTSPVAGGASEETASESKPKKKGFGAAVKEALGKVPGFKKKAKEKDEV